MSALRHGADAFPTSWCASPTFEVMPLKSLAAQIPHLPQGARVHVTRSPGKPCEQTLAAAGALKAQRPDLTVVPHLAARMIRDREHLDALLQGMAKAGLRDAFVVSGDATDVPAGSYRDGFGVIADVRSHYPDFGSITIPGYPGGHPFIANADLQRALDAKAPLADAIATQLCFNPHAIVAWLKQLAAAGIHLPVRIGVPGILSQARLLRIATEIGIGPSIKFLRRHGRTVAGLATAYTPDKFLHELAGALTAARLDIAGLHLNTFNQVEAIANWRQQCLADG